MANANKVRTCLCFDGRGAEAARLYVSLLPDREIETDRLWEALTADGGKESQCGWLVDRFGVSWQIVPKALPRLLGAEDPDATQRVHDAMMGMRKLDVAALEAAFRGD